MIGPYQMLPLRARVDLAAMLMKGYSAFPKAPALHEPDHQIVSLYPRHLLAGSYPSADMQLVYSRAPPNWARSIWVEMQMILNSFSLRFWWANFYRKCLLLAGKFINRHDNSFVLNIVFCLWVLVGRDCLTQVTREPRIHSGRQGRHTPQGSGGRLSRL